jgi:predicted nucleic acid-binding protein
LILVDTSVWVDHLRRGDAQLVDLLESNAVIMHPFVIGEIACGSLSDRAQMLELLHQLPSATVADHDEVMGYIERHCLHGKGIGYVDVHLLASTAISGAKLWTRDKRLRVVAQELGCALVDASKR